MQKNIYLKISLIVILFLQLSACANLLKNKDAGVKPQNSTSEINYDDIFFFK